MARQPHLAIRIDDDTKARWSTAARDAGQTLAAFIRDTVDAAITGATFGESPDVADGLRQPDPGSIPGASIKTKRTKPAAVKAECSRLRFHRSGTYCKECGTVPA